MQDELTALEEMMDSWMGAHALGEPKDHRSDDIATYVVAQVSGKPMKLPQLSKDKFQNGAAPRSKRVYGYQEPTQMRKAPVKLPMLQYQVDNSGFNLRTTNAHIPAYSRDTDPHCQKLLRKNQKVVKRSMSAKPLKLRKSVTAAPKPATAGSLPPHRQSPAQCFKLLKVCEAENGSLMQQVAEARSMKAGFLKRIQSAKEETVQLRSQCSSARHEVSLLEKAVQRLSTVKSKHTLMLHQVKQREQAIKELRQMRGMASRRLQELEAKAPPPKTDIESAPNKSDFRDHAKSRETLKCKIESLLLQRNQLVSTINKASVRHNDRSKQRNEIISKMEREKQLAKLELERKLISDLEKEVIRLRENHEKAYRYRLREIQQKAKEMEQSKTELEKRFESHYNEGSQQTKELTELSINVASLQTKHAELQKSLNALQESLSVNEQKVTSLKEREAVVVGQIGKAEVQLEVAKAAPEDSLKPFEEQVAQERDKIAFVAVHHQASITTLLEVIGRLEEDVNANSGQNRGSNIKALETDRAKLQDEIQKLSEDIDFKRKRLKEFLQKNLEDDARQCSRIEILTKENSGASKQLEELNVKNVSLLEELDLAERMIAMNNLQA